MSPYLIRPAARADIDRAYDWYEQQGTGRGDEFLLELSERIRDIRSSPQSFGRVRGKVHAARMKRSRFIIYFRIKPSGIEIIAVQHARANPSKWKRR